MMTARGFADELRRLIGRADHARLDPTEIAAALQTELDEIDDMMGAPVRLGLVTTPESQ